MILQCDQCQTKFRLDDSKLKPGGVKVRCSKCRHVFVAGAEPKQEESDFDAILSGLGGPAPEKREEPAAGEPAGFGFGEEPAAAEAPAAKAAAAVVPAPETAAPATPTVDEFPDFSSFDFAPEPAAAKEKPAAMAEEPGFKESDFGDIEEPVVRQEQDAVTSPGLDFGEFAFEEEAPAAQLKAEPAMPSAEDTFEFGELPFAAEPAATGEKAPPAPEAPGTGLDFGEIEFTPEPAEKPQQGPAVSAPELDFGEFSFNEEPAVQGAEPAAAKEFDYGEFSFEEEPPALKEAPGAGPVEDFSAFTFEEEPPPVKETPAAGPVEDFGAFSFEEEPPALKETPAAEPAEEFGGFSFTEEAPKVQEKAAAPAPEEEFSLGDFSFGDEVQKQPEKAHAPLPEEELALGEFSFEEDLAPKQEKPAAAPKEAFSFSDFSFGDGVSDKLTTAAAGLTGATAKAAAPVTPGVEEGPAGPAPEGAAPSGPVPPVVPPSETKGSPFDFDFGGPVPTKAEGFAEEEELPPLSISSRRKGRSIFTISIVAIAVLIILALTGAGLYLLQKGPAAVQTFNKMGIGFVGKWFGVESVEEGRITIKNAQASFYQNKEAGEIFVVTGEAVNSFSKPRASIHVKVNIYDKKGAVLVQKTAYCGNRLSKEQLETLPMAKIESIMNNQFGDSLANLGVKPGQSIGFVVALANVPKDAADFGVEVLGSTVAGQ